MNQMTEEEKLLMDLTGDIWDRFLALPELHPSDGPEFAVHIHALQNMILARVGYREYTAKLPMQKKELSDVNLWT
jgi:hypothetical protein